MNANENKQKRTEELSELLTKADKLAPESRAEFLTERGVRVVGQAEWIRDETYTGNNKEIYHCSRCDHWQSVKKQKNQIMYMRYCPFCGSEMGGKPT